MDQINVYEAKTHFSRLLQRVEAGEEIIISRAGRPIARLVMYRGVTGPRTPGAWRGRIHISEDFDSIDSFDLDDDLAVALMKLHPDLTKAEVIERAIRIYLAQAATERLRSRAGSMIITDVSASLRDRDRHT